MVSQWLEAQVQKSDTLVPNESFVINYAMLDFSDFRKYDLISRQTLGQVEMRAIVCRLSNHNNIYIKGQGQSAKITRMERRVQGMLCTQQV